MRHIEAEPRVRVKVENAMKIGSALARVLLDVHILEHHPPAQASQGTLSNEQVRVENSVELPREGDELVVTAATEVCTMLAGACTETRSKTSSAARFWSRKRTNESSRSLVVAVNSMKRQPSASAFATALSQSSRSSTKAPVAIPKFCGELTHRNLVLSESSLCRLLLVVR
jgi:hypothetical protein